MSEQVQVCKIAIVVAAIEIKSVPLVVGRGGKGAQVSETDEQHSWVGLDLVVGTDIANDVLVQSRYLTVVIARTYSHLCQNSY